MGKRKRLLALLLCLMLCLSLFPEMAFAEEENAEPTAEETAEATDTDKAEADNADVIVEDDDSVLPEEVLPEVEDVIEEEAAEDVIVEEDVFVVEEQTESEAHVYDPNLPKLAEPSNLRWDDEYPGVLDFTVSQPFQYQINYELYQVGKDDRLANTSVRGYEPEDLESEIQFDFFSEEIQKNGSGDYYIVLYSAGDGVEYSDSERVQSSVWHYEKPSAALPKPEKPVMNGITASFIVPEGVSYLIGFAVEVRFAKTLDEEPSVKGKAKPPIYFETVHPGVNTWDIYDYALESNGPGYYSVRICFRSKDIIACGDSEWSEWSEPSDITAIQIGMNYQLQEINANTDSMSEDEIRSAVQNLDSYILKSAMETDQDGSGVVSTMKELEEKLGGTEVMVAPEMSGSFNPDEIDVTGAQLNTPETVGTPISFVLDKPKYNDVLPAMYNNSVAVRFSMDLVNADTSGMLDVPVKVVLPIPAGINPDFLAVLHYHVNGGVPEAILPYVFQENGKYYAAFVLTSFSDFVFTEPLENTVSFQTTLNLADYTGINVYIELPEGEDASAYTVESSYKSYRQTSNKYEKLSSLPKGSGERAGMYKFDALHAASTEMSDVVTVKLLKSGEVVKTEQYSVRSIAEEKLAAGGLDAETETLYRALLQYGRYGQLTFGNKTDDLPGTDGAPALAPILAAYAPSGDPTNFGAYVTKFERKLDLNAATSMNLYISFASGYTKNDFIISVLDKDGKSYPTSKWSVTDMGNNRVRIKIEGVLSPQMARNFSVRVTLKSDTTKTATWNSSVLTCAYVYDRTLSGDAKNLMQALYQYWLASAARFPQYR